MRYTINAIFMTLFCVGISGCTPTESHALMSLLQNENAALRSETTALRVENSQLRAQLLGTSQWQGLIQLDRVGSVDTGTFFLRVCPQGEALIGFRGRAGGFIDALIPVCGLLPPLAANIESGGTPIRRELDLVGGGGGSNFERLCPSDSYVKGMNGAAAGYLDSLEVVCQSIAGTADETAEAEPTGDSSAWETATEERASLQVRQNQPDFRIRQSPAGPQARRNPADSRAEPDRTDSSQAQAQTEAAQDSQTEGAATSDRGDVTRRDATGRPVRLQRIGGPGGTRFQRSCPPHWIAVGVSGRSGLYVNGVSMICAPWSPND